MASPAEPSSSSTSPGSDQRYDRQIRLWGDDGQSAIQTTSVAVLGSSALGTEILKSLVLAGIERFVIVDDAVVTEPDLGNNFFVEASDLGGLRAEAAVRLLSELNPSVRGTAIIRRPTAEAVKELRLRDEYSVLVATNLPERDAASIADPGFEATPQPFISVRAFGLLGYLRVCVREHTIFHTHAENVAPDLRLDRPFPALQALIDSTDLESLKNNENGAHKLHHTPYIILYTEALKAYRKDRNDPSAFPSTYAERKEFLPYVMRLQVERESGGTNDENFDQARASLARSMLPTKVPSSIAAILADAKCADAAELPCKRTPFWIMCTALRRFVERHRALPLPGNLPDMASDSASYLNLFKIYHEQAVEDAEEIYREVVAMREQGYSEEEESPRGVKSEGNDDLNVITKESCARFCKNAGMLALQRGSPISSQRGEGFKTVLSSLVYSVGEDEIVETSAHPSLWFLLLRAVDRFHEEKLRFPGTNGIPRAIDAMDVRKRVDSIVHELLPEEGVMDDNVTAASVLKRVTSAAIDEICRYGAGELHTTAALLGGIAAQEVIKLATRQYIPVNNTLIIDGITGNAETFAV